MTEVTGREAGLKFLSRSRHFGGSKSDRNLRRRPHMTMKIAGGLREDGIVVGNLYDKYGSRHLFLRLLMKGFDTALSDTVAGIASFHTRCRMWRGYLGYSLERRRHNRKGI